MKLVQEVFEKQAGSKKYLPFPRQRNSAGLMPTGIEKEEVDFLVLSLSSFLWHPLLVEP